MITEYKPGLNTVYAVSPQQMKDWQEICKAFAKKLGAELLFVNETSCGLQHSDGSFSHVYIDEMRDYLEQIERTTS